VVAEHPLILDPEAADARGESSVQRICTIFSNSRVFPFINTSTPIPRFTDLDERGVDVVAKLLIDHPFTQALGSDTLYVQSKSRDLHLIHFQKARVVNYGVISPEIIIPEPLVALNGQRPDADIVGDTYTQLLLYMGLLHDGKEIIYPNPLQTEIEHLLDACGDEAKQITLAQLNQGILRRNRGVKKVDAASNPYFFTRQQETLQRLIQLFGNKSMGLSYGST